MTVACAAVCMQAQPSAELMQKVKDCVAEINVK